MKNDKLIEVGGRLKEIRRALDLSQKEFAAALDISASYLSEIESGKTKPGFNFIDLIYKKYDINPGWFVEGEGEMFVAKDQAKKVREEEFGNQTSEVLEMLDYMKSSPFVRSSVLSYYTRFFYENEEIIKKDIEKNKNRKLS